MKRREKAKVNMSKVELKKQNVRKLKIPSASEAKAQQQTF